jgi:UDP-3-O-acyl N-acetylglycosamine deacetylase
MVAYLGKVGYIAVLGTVYFTYEFLSFAFHFSIRDGWLNSPLRFPDEPCRHKMLDFVGDFSLLAQNGNKGLPIAHILAHKVSGAWGGKCAV